MLTYYDHIRGTHRFKRRFTWAVWAFAMGILCGVVMAYAL